MTDFEPKFAAVLLEKINKLKTQRARRKFLAQLAFCNAHFSRKVQKHVSQAESGVKYYNENTMGFRAWTKKLPNLNCLPCDDIESAFSELLEEAYQTFNGGIRRKGKRGSVMAAAYYVHTKIGEVYINGKLLKKMREKYSLR